MSDAGTDRGWIPAHRKLYDPGHPLAPSKRDPSCRRDAWLDLCQMAQHAPRIHCGEQLQRGEVLVAIRTKAEHWGWSKSRVSRFFSRLASGTMIGTVRGTPHGTVYRIVNYDTYAVVWDTERDSNRDSERNASGTAAGQEQPLQPLQPKSIAPRARPKVPLPEGWSPTPEHRQRAASLKVDVEREVESFRAHAETHDRRAASWNAAFTTWLLKAEHLAGNGNGPPKRNPPPTYPDLRAASAWLPQGHTP